MNPFKSRPHVAYATLALVVALAVAAPWGRRSRPAAAHKGRVAITSRGKGESEESILSD
jgi:hypothetical protein